jgi:hypothetical protein
MDKENQYIIPAKFRKMENTHILFWLLKDISWCLGFKVLGTAMIVPTLIIAAIIAWRTRHFVSELAHNLAIFFWICANSFWMVTEFLKVDEHLKLYALIPFCMGLLPLIFYYCIYSPRQYYKRKAELEQSGHKVLPIDGDVAGEKGSRVLG